MQRFKTIKQACAIGVLLLSSSALAQAQHDDGHEHETTAKAVEQETPSAGIINATCPVTTDEKVDPAFTIEYNGQTVGFCCKKCRRRFDEDPEKYLAELPMLQAASMTTQESAHDEGEAHEHAEGSADEHDEAGDGDHDEHADDDHDEGGEPHDHATGHGQEKKGLAKLIPWLGKFHPPTTHIPIGLLVGAALAEALFMVTKRDLFRNAGTFCVVVAGFGALAAVTLGWFNGGFTLVDKEWTQTVHRWLGTSTMLLTLVTIGMLVRASKANAKPSARRWYRIFLFTSAGMVGVTGFFGGVIVYGLNHYAW